MLEKNKNCVKKIDGKDAYYGIFLLIKYKRVYTKFVK